MIRENPFMRVVLWILNWPQLLQGALLVAVVVSCFGVSLAAFETRQKYSRLQALVSEADNLDSEYEKLLLEQSAWAGYARIDEISRGDLGMQIPEGEHVVVISQ
ncbi:MAG: cell division protein FtsL [Patiriisocius sp.]|jgi:cell division protein FtsL